MPTARELLEQADALMRRNRSPLMDDIPVLTDSVPETRAVRPARLRPTLPDAKGPDSIPMLTERAPEPAKPAPVAPESPAEDSAVVEEGEPSDWLQLGGGEPSAIGEAPDSIAVVPSYVEEAREEIEVEAPPEVEAAFDAELAERASEAAPAEPPSPEPVPVPHPPASVADVEPLPAPDEWEADTVIDERPADERAATEPAQPVEWSGLPAEDSPDEEARAFEDVNAIEEALAVGESHAVEEAHAAREPPVEEAPATEPGPSPAERQAAEDARWASMAEEIRMQVLQRIDLFTDTGLRDQLGSRLQPIVDRASADLVATINQHVGELLRAYVAEAIEREIENWRHGQP
jgi:hypothetical protein